MRATMRGAAIILTALVLAFPANGGADAAAGFKPIYKVDSAAASIRGGRMTIMASGAVSTGGWSKAHLRLKLGHTPQTSAIEFDFVAMPPPADETVIQALVPVTVSLTTKLPPYAVTQIRIDTQTNSTTATIKR